MRKLYLGIVIGLLMAGGAVAQNVQTSGDIDTVILVTTSNYPDTTISAAVTERLGVPVFLTERDQLSAPARNGIEQFNPEEVIIVGGPAVISDQVQSTVEEMTNTTRLWGTTQIGTSVEVSDYFWTSGSERVTIVQYPQDKDGHRLLGTVRNDIDGEGPVLLSKEGTLSANVLSEVERLGATEAEVYSTSAVNVTEDLRSVGVQEVEIEEAEQEELSERLKQRTQVDNRSELVIVAAANFRHTISVPVAPNGASYIVSSEEQIDGAVNLAAQAENNTAIKVVGKPDLASMIADRIENQTDRKVDRVSGTPEEAAAREMEKNREVFENRQKKKLQKWKDEVKNNPGLVRSANRTLQNARERVNENSSEKVRNMFQKAENAYEDEDYFQARRLAVGVLSNARAENYRELEREDIRERVREEREDMREASREIQENNQEMAQELREAEDVEERLDIIKKYREERRESMEDMKEEMHERREEMNESEERDTSGETAEESELKIEIEGNEIKSEASYTARTGGYTMTKNVSQSDNSVRFDFEIHSPDDGQLTTQVLTELEQESEVTVEEGSYSVKAVLSMDGNVLKSVGENISVTGSPQTDSDDSVPETATVNYTDSGFAPKTVEVQKDGKVMWNDLSRSSDMWVATANHPSHTKYDGTSTSDHCENGESDTFDQCSTGESYSFEFEKTGEWGYHNHVNAQHTGKVVVK